MPFDLSLSKTTIDPHLISIGTLVHWTCRHGVLSARSCQRRQSAIGYASEADTRVRRIGIPMDVEKWGVEDEYDEVVLARLGSTWRASGYVLDD